MFFIKKIIPIFFIITGIMTIAPNPSTSAINKMKDIGKNTTKELLLSNNDKIELKNKDNRHYTFEYHGDTYEAEFQPEEDNKWTIYNSYKIDKMADIYNICKLLSEEHPVPSSDGKSYRTPKDMTFEWKQHNIAYQYLPDGNQYKEMARNVDLDPDDQGKTFLEIYEDRTGNKLDYNFLLNNKGKIKRKIKELLKMN